VKSFQLASSFGKTLIGVKILALIGAFLFVLLSFPNTAILGSPLVFWGMLLLLCAGTIALFLSFGGPPYRQEKQLLISLGIDLVALTYLFLLLPEAILALLLGLVIVCGFNNFVLPRTSGTLVSVLCTVLYSVSILLAMRSSGAQEYGIVQAMANWIPGLLVLIAVIVLVRKLKRTVDSAYIVSDNLAFELASQTIDSEIDNDELAERNKEINVLMEILSQIVSVLDWDELFESIMDTLRERFEFDKFCIYLFNSDSGMLDLEVEIGGDRATGVSTSVKPDHGLVGWCYSHSEGLMINDVSRDKRYMNFNERGKRILSLACQPLVYRGDKLGVLCLDSSKTGMLNEKSYRFLERLTPLIAIAVSNSLNFRSVKAESNTDSLTGLNNHRGFMEKFLVALDAAYREKSPLAFLILDIDNFKQINDTYGHLVGNLVLTDLAEILTNFFRSADFVARWGGEEFVVVLSNTPPDIAPRICEQLRRKVESHQFPISLEKDAFKQVTVSLGLSSTQDSNLEAEMVSGSRRGETDVFVKNVHELAESIATNADEAMYVAKREGKNALRLSHHYPVDQPEPSFEIVDR